MSGGYFNYKDEDLMEDIFGITRVTLTSKSYQDELNKVAESNPLEDLEISELVFDVLGLLHSFDWYKECDTDREAYLAGVKAFKKKWFGVDDEARLNRQILKAQNLLANQAKMLSKEIEECFK